MAFNQAVLVNHNFTFSEENARLREIITLRKDDASLQQKLDSYTEIIQNLESMVAGDHAVQTTTSVVVVTFVGSAHNTTPVGDAHRPMSQRPTWPHRQSLEAQLAHMLTCLPPKQTGLRALVMPLTHPKTVYNSMQEGGIE